MLVKPGDVIRLLLATWFVCLMTTMSHSQGGAPPNVLLQDDFDSGFSLDWKEFGPPGSTFEVVNGGAVITPGGDEFTGIEIHDFGPSDFSVITQVSLSGPTTGDAFPYVYAHNVEDTGLWAGISSMNRSLSVGDLVNGSITTRVTENVGLDVVGDLINFQVDFIAPALRFKAWAEGTAEPSGPQIVWVDERFTARDRITIGLSPSPNLAPVRWGKFEVREPPLFERTDFDFDGTIDTDDMNQICWVVRQRRVSLSRFARFDLNADSALNPDDVGVFLTEHGFLPGDADLDGQVDFEDFLALSANFGERGGGEPWGLGDFDCNGQIEFSDFLLLSVNFESAGPAAAVPEPGFAVLAIIGCLVVMHVGRERIRS